MGKLYYLGDPNPKAPFPEICFPFHLIEYSPWMNCFSDKMDAKNIGYDKRLHKVYRD